MSPTPERELPELLKAIERLKVAAYKAGRGDDDATDGTEEMADVRHAIAAALEPEWALKERCERLRRLTLRFGPEVRETSFAIGYLQPGDLADDLTATSSANVRRDGVE